MTALPSPPAETDAVVAWVAEHLGDLTLEGPEGVRPGAIRGGQPAADAALAALDVTGYAYSRSNVLPVSSRGATRLSPYIRHGLLQLPTVWHAVATAPGKDRFRYRDELMWQEYSRHLYARVGRDSNRSLRHQPPPAPVYADEPWPERMECISYVVQDMHEGGWMVNQTRMWLASHWTVRSGWEWQRGEAEFFTHLLDGSRAANRLGWQWTVGAGTGKPYGFSRWQVMKRAPELCDRCPLSDACPIEEWPADTPGPKVEDGPFLGRGPTPAGPDEPVPATAEQVWLTAESLGDADPALAADPDRPAVFVFDEPLLRRLRLSGKRLVFLAETLGALAQTRPLEVRRGRPTEELAGRSLATTYAPVPGWKRIAGVLRPEEVQPWPWLARPREAPLTSYTAWRKAVRR